MSLPSDIENRYEILETLQEGGMGTVYKVRDRRLNRILVAKTILMPESVVPQEREELRERFRREADLSASLDHPNIAHIHDRSADGAWIIMEFVEGLTLRDLLDEGRLPIALALEISRQTLRALGYLHRQGSIHRDISPENLMLTRDPEGVPLVKLIDLGIARSVSEKGPQLTVRGGFIGKPRYAAPEHLEDRDILHASDIYSFGIVLYELLTGIHPFRGRTSELRPGRPRPSPLSFELSDRRGRIPSDLRAIVLIAIAEDPESRFRSAEAMAAELEKIQRRFPLHTSEVDAALASAASTLTVLGGAGEDLLVRHETHRSPGVLLPHETETRPHSTDPLSRSTTPTAAPAPTCLPPARLGPSEQPLQLDLAAPRLPQKFATSSIPLLARLFAAIAVLALLLWTGSQLLSTRQIEPDMAAVPEPVTSSAPITAPASSGSSASSQPAHEKPTAGVQEPRNRNLGSSERNGAIAMGGATTELLARLSTIQYPGNGEIVGKYVTVRGTISGLAPNQRAFLCIKSRTFGRLIYPQGELLPTANGRWFVEAIYASAGYEYETFVVIVESADGVKGIDLGYSRLYGMRGLPPNSFVAGSLVTVVRK